MTRILLLGGAGKIALHLTPLLLSRSANHLTSVIRDPAQTATIEAAAKGQPGTSTVLVRSLEEVTSEERAKGIIEEASAEWVVWSAGKGGVFFFLIHTADACWALLLYVEYTRFLLPQMISNLYLLNSQTSHLPPKENLRTTIAHIPIFSVTQVPAAKVARRVPTSSTARPVSTSSALLSHCPA